jgi:hypothetical protein
MTTLTPLPDVDANNSSVIQAAIDANDDIEFAAGEVFNIGTVLQIRPGKRLWTDPTNPATLKRTGTTIRTTVVNGADISIENLQFDWNFGGAWREFNTHISLAPPAGSGITPSGSYDHLRIIGCRFIESTTSGSHSNSDSWCISMVPGAAADIDDVKILGCYSDSLVQLVGNGTLTGTWSNIEIAYNVIYNAQNAAIGFSSLARAIEDRETIFGSVDIHHNIIRNTYGIGIFVGQDGSAPADGTVQINSLKIRDNYIEAGKVADFNIGILVRPGAETGYTAYAEIERNVISILDAQKAGKQPRTISFSSAQGGSTLLFRDNKRSGVGSVATTNVTVTQSGNTNLDGTSWSL